MNIEAYKDREPLADHCGIVAVFADRDIEWFQTGLRTLQIIQTRGYDGAGFWASRSDGTTYCYKGSGMIEEVFSPEVLRMYRSISARIWVYHVRYGTSGNFSQTNVQPLVMTHKRTGEAFVVAHNGQFSRQAGSELSGTSDTHQFARELSETNCKGWDERICSVLSQRRGAWSLAVGTRHALYIARDSWGFRPLVYGHIPHPSGNGYYWIVASETSCLDTSGAIDCFELLPGAIAKITSTGLEVIARHKTRKNALCIFENVYIHHGGGKAFMPRKNQRDITRSSSIDDIRRRSGEILAREAPLTRHDADMVIGIPGTGIEGGMRYALSLNIPYLQTITDRTSSFMEQRTFMNAGVDGIYAKVLTHFAFDEQALRGRRVVLVDDSIVRGNITKGIVSLLKGSCEVKTVHIRILCPPIDKPCHLGINTRSVDELIAARHIGETAAIQEEIGADSLVYLSAAGLREAITGDPHARGFCMGCMVGQRHPIDAYGNDAVSRSKQKGNGQHRVERSRRVQKHAYIHAYA